MMSANDFIIRKARSDEQSMLLTLTLQQYVPRMEPSVSYFRDNAHRVDEAEKAIIAKDMESRYAALISKNPCFVAIHKESKKIVGIILMKIEKNPKFQETVSDFKTSVDLQSKVYGDFINYVVTPLGQNFNFFAKFPELEAVLYLMALCVDSNYSGCGLATRLVDASIKYAESINFNLIYGAFTSPFSQRAAQKCEFHTFSNVDLLSFHDGDGNVIFKNTESFVALVMAKYLKPIASNEYYKEDSF